MEAHYMSLLIIKMRGSYNELSSAGELPDDFFA